LPLFTGKINKTNKMCFIDIRMLDPVLQKTPLAITGCNWAYE